MTDHINFPLVPHLRPKMAAGPRHPKTALSDTYITGVWNCRVTKFPRFLGVMIWIPQPSCPKAHMLKVCFLAGGANY